MSIMLKDLEQEFTVCQISDPCSQKNSLNQSEESVRCFPISGLKSSEL